MTIDQPEATAGPPGDAPTTVTPALADVPADQPVAEPPAGGWTIPPVQTPVAPAKAGGLRPWRWWIAIVATVIVIAAAAGVALVTTRAATSATIAYVPANALVYAEGRLDMPGDQGATVASFLSHFPGFSDTSNLQTKLNDTWDRLLGRIPGNKYTYSADIAPWVQGTVGVAVLPGASPSSPEAVALVAVADQAKAQSELDKIVADAKSAGRVPIQSTVGGATVWTFPSAAGSAPAAGHAMHVALLPGMLVVANDTAAITAVQDVKSGAAASLASSQAYRDASAGAASSNLASIYISTASLRQQVAALVPSAAPAASALASPLVACAAQAIPTSVYGTLRAQADQLVADLRAPLPAGSSPAPARQSALADHVPGNALAYLETHDLGKALACLATQIKAALPAASGGSPANLGQVEGMLGGQLESFVSWLGDAGIVVEAPAAGQQLPVVGIIATVTDATLATQRLGELQSLAGLAAASGLAGISVSAERDGAATITTLSVASSALPVPGSIGGAGGTPPTVDISWTLSDGRFVLGLGPSVVRSFLDLPSGQSLGATPSFTAALASAGGPATGGFAYLDLRAIRATAEALIPSADRSGYEANIRPYLLPFDRLVVVNGLEGSTTTTRAIITVSNPQ
jgi:hypothetical protein